MLVKYLDERKELWDEYLNTCVYAYNTTHESTKFSPFELMFGRKVVLPIDINTGMSDPDAVLQEFQNSEELCPSQLDTASSKQKHILEEAKRNIVVAQQRQKDQYDRKYGQSGLYIPLQLSAFLGYLHFYVLPCRRVSGWDEDADEGLH